MQKQDYLNCLFDNVCYSADNYGFRRKGGNIVMCHEIKSTALNPIYVKRFVHENKIDTDPFRYPDERVAELKPNNMTQATAQMGSRREKNGPEVVL